MPLPPDLTVKRQSGDGGQMIPEGVYQAEIINIDYIAAENTTFGKEQLAFRFKITEGSYKDVEIRSWVTLAFNAGWEGGSPSNLYLLACAALNEELNDSEEFNPNNLMGKELSVVIEVRRSQTGREVSRITKYLKKGAAKS